MLPEISVTIQTTNFLFCFLSVKIVPFSVLGPPVYVLSFIVRMRADIFTKLKNLLNQAGFIDAM